MGKKYILFSLILLLIMPGCSNTTVTKYDYKEENGQIDKSVEIKQKQSIYNGQLEVSFETKQIPVEININGNRKSYELRIDVSGEFENGNINMSLIYNQVKDHSIIINSGKVDKKTRYEYYGGPYKILIEFNNTNKGKIKLKYQILST